MEIFFTVHPNYTEVTGDVDWDVIDKATRFKKSGYRHSNAYKKHVWDGYTRLLRKGAFPTGLVERVKRAYKKAHKDVVIQIDDRREFKDNTPSIKDITIKGVTLRRHQIAAADAMIKKRHGVLWAATNSGKTEISIAVLKALNLNALFLVKGKDLLEQTYRRFQARLGEKDVGIISSSTWDERKFTIASADTLARRLVPSRNRKDTKVIRRQEQVADLLRSQQVVVIDECHTAASAGLWNVVRFCTASYRFGLSGTPFKRGDNQDLKLIALTGDIIYKISNKEMIEDGVSTPTDIIMVDIDYPTIARYAEYRDVYDAGITHNDFRNEVIGKLIKKHYDEGKNIVVMIKEIAHGEILSEILAKEVFLPHLFIHGSTPIERRTEILKDFQEGLVNILITSVILDQGIDIPNIDVLILAGGGASKIKSLQRIGRGLRINEGKENLLVIDFADRTHRYLAKHSYERLNSYSGEECFNIDLMDGTYVSQFQK